MAIIVLVSVALTAFHLYEFHVLRLIRNGSASALVALLVTLVELIARLKSGPQAERVAEVSRGAVLDEQAQEP